MAAHQAGGVPVSEVRATTTTTDEMLAFVNQTYVGARARPGAGGDSFRYDVTGYATPSLQVASYRYSRGLTLDLDPFGYLMSSAVISGNVEMRAGGSRLPAARPRSSCIRSPARCG